MRYMLLLPIVWIALHLTFGTQNQQKSTVPDLSCVRCTREAATSPEGPAHCFECHSEPDFKNGWGQPRPGTKGAGQIIKNEAFNGEPFPDGLVCPNITPDKETGAGNWTGAQFECAISYTAATRCCKVANIRHSIL